MGGARRGVVGACAVVVVAATVAAPAAAAVLGRARPGDPGDRLVGSPPSIVTESGGPLADGLDVPEGLRLVGGVFPTRDSSPDGRVEPGWAALLEVAGNPFDAWDAIVDELGRAGLELPGSSAACLWQTARDVRDGGGTVDVGLTGTGPPPDTLGLSCDGEAVGGEADDGATRRALVELDADVEGAWVGIDVDHTTGGTPDPSRPSGPPATGADRSDVRFADPPPEPGRRVVGPVPAEPGELFPANLCGEWSGAPPLRVPPASRVVARVPSSPLFEVTGSFGVVATVDAEAAVRWFRDRFRSAGSADSTVLEREVGVDGAESWVLDEADGMAGTCVMRTSADGRAVLVGRIDMD